MSQSHLEESSKYKISTENDMKSESATKNIAMKNYTKDSNELLQQKLNLDIRNVDSTVLQQVILLAIEIAREGREGRKIGTLFTVGDEQEVLQRSKSLILDPLYGHPYEKKDITLPDMRETIKEIAQLDGAFVVDKSGYVLSACRFLNSNSEGVFLPLGFGTRHMAAASISKSTECIAVAVSQSGFVRVFDDGDLVNEIFPELWLLSKYDTHIKGTYIESRNKDVTILSKR